MDDVAEGDGVSGVDFSDERKAREWLEKQSIEIRSTIASRAALRVSANVLAGNSKKFQNSILEVFRDILSSTLVGFGIHKINGLEPTAGDSAEAVVYSAQSANFASQSVASAPRSAAMSASISAVRSVAPANRMKYPEWMQGSVPRSASWANAVKSDAGRATLSAATYDTANPDLREFSAPLWPSDEVPADVAKNHTKFLRKLRRHKAIWSFWYDWYLAMWEGRFTDWDLATKVAEIPDRIWRNGARAVAVEIETLRATQLQSEVPQAETVEFDPTTQRFSAHAIPVEKPDLIGATLEQVQDSLEDVLASTSNGLSKTSREVRVIERTIKKYGNNPQRIEMDFVSAHASLTRQIIVSELPASEENLALQSALEEGALAIRATHPDVAENRAILKNRRFSELSDDQKALLAEALPILRAISDDELADDWQNDIPALINTSIGPLPSGAPTLPGADEATRIFSRAAKISILLRTGDVIHAIDKSAGYKGARIILTVGGLVGLGLALLALV